MKKTLFLVLILGLVFVLPVFAEDNVGTTGNADWDSQGIGPIPAPTINQFLTESQILRHSHTFDIPERENQVGVGADFILWRNRKEDALLNRLTAETKYDFMNKEWAGYLVGTVDLSIFYQ